MSIAGKKSAAATMIMAAGLCVAVGVSMSIADEPKTPHQPATPQIDPPALPRLFAERGIFNSAEVQKAQEQMRHAMETLSKNPNDAEARKQLGEVQQTLMSALGGNFANDSLPLLRGGRHERPRLGVRLEPVTPLVSDQLGLEQGKGVAIAEVIQGSAAEKAGFKVHDIVTEFAGKPVTNPAEFHRQVSTVKVGEKVDAVVVRKGKKVEVKGIDLPTPQREASALPQNPNAIEKGRGRAGDTISVSLSNDAFTIKATQAGVNYLITGKTGPDGAVAEKVSIKDGNEATESQEIGKVPEKYRPTVEKLLKLVGKPHAKVQD